MEVVLRAVVLIVLGASLATACASPKTPLARLRDGGSVKVDGDTRTLLAALDECRAADADGDETWMRIHDCNIVIEELRRRRNQRELEIYGSQSRMRALTSSCSAAKDAVAVAGSLRGPLAAPGGEMLPPMSALRDAGPRREWTPPSEGEGSMMEHARALVRCGDGDSLGKLLEMRDGLAQDLLREDRRAVLAMIDGGKAPARLATMAGSLPERRPCPATSEEVVALMRASREEDRIHGCSCTSRLSADLRADAERERRRLVADDPHSVTTTSRPPPSSSPDLTNAPAGVGLAVMLPLMLQGLLSARGSSHTHYPVREACAATLPVEGQTKP